MGCDGSRRVGGGTCISSGADAHLNGDARASWTSLAISMKIQIHEASDCEVGASGGVRALRLKPLRTLGTRFQQ